MSAAELLPRVPALPHDPLRIVLDGRAGWRFARPPNGAEITRPDRVLALAPLREAVRLLAEPTGSFGGLTPPRHAVLTSDGNVLLLDRQQVVLKRFDPCTCTFATLACIAGRGTEPRRLAEPGGIDAACGQLYVCDTGNRRVQVFGLRGFVLRALWSSPSGPALAQPWVPVDVAADGHGHVYVADPANGSVHVFHASGRRLRSFEGVGAVAHVAVDCEGRLYVHVQGEPGVRVVDVQTGATREQFDRADEVATRFAPMPFVVTREGHLRFSVSSCGQQGAVFDATGTRVVQGAEPAAAYYQDRGNVLTIGLDSALYRCQWDRLELEGEFPEHTTVRAFVYTAETELPLELVEQLAPGAWTACPELVGSHDAATVWDCLVQPPPGRYLWLKLEIEGDGHVSPRITNVALVFPRISLRRYLPGVFGADPVGADFTDRFLAIFDREFRRIEHTFDDQARLFDPLSAPSDDNPRRDFLSWLATWIGVSLDRGWTEERRRRYLKQVGQLLPRRGTLGALKQHLQLYMGLDAAGACGPLPACGPCTTRAPVRWQPPELVLEHYRLRRWLFLNRGRLGEQARLWGERIVNRSRLASDTAAATAQLGASQLRTSQDPFRDPFHVYAHKFTVFAPANMARSAAARRGLERLVRSERPAHTAYQIVYVEPRFRIGIQSMIGFDSAVGSYPGGMTLSGTRLGRASVLGPENAGGETLSVGKQARIGTTTRLT
jgi:phage tail-like protein